MLATFVVILNETIMVNAIPRLMGELSVTARSAQWLSTGFMLTMAVVIPVTGWFLQRVSTRAAFATAMTVFCAGTLLAASWRATDLVDGGAAPLDALVGGMRWAFAVGALLSVAVLLLALRLPGRPVAEDVAEIPHR